jgi:hypothetical protein
MANAHKCIRNTRYAFIGARSGRHGWENFAPLAMQSLPMNHSDVPSMFPLTTLAKFSVWADMNATSPRVPQHTLWAETWRNEAVNASLQPSCVPPDELAAAMAQWDRDIRSAFASQPPRDRATRRATAVTASATTPGARAGSEKRVMVVEDAPRTSVVPMRATGRRLSTAAAPSAGGALFGVWLVHAPSAATELPYLRGTQAVAQWRDVQPAADVYNFSALDASAASALALMPAGREPMLTVQVRSFQNGHALP